MSTFEVKVYAAKIEAHPNADSIELARIGDYLSIVQKGQFKDGDLLAYIPEASLCPQEIVSFLGLEGKLAGSSRNRVKAIKLRGVLSQGLVYPARDHWKLGDEVSNELGITKWEHPVPARLAGEVQHSPYKFNFDIENIKKYPHIFQDGEEVIFIEKIHGSCMITSLVPEQDRQPEMIDGKLIVISKGLAARQLFFKDNEKNQENSYVKCAKQNNIAEILSKLSSDIFGSEVITTPIWVVGELYGMQDLKYGTNKKDLQFRVFGIRYGQRWLNWDLVELISKMCNFKVAPLLYQGPFSKQILEKYTTGKETISGTQAHIREGVVVYPIQERLHADIGRVILKSISEDYLLRKGETSEFT